MRSAFDAAAAFFFIAAAMVSLFESRVVVVMVMVVVRLLLGHRCSIKKCPKYLSIHRCYFLLLLLSFLLSLPFFFSFILLLL